MDPISNAERLVQILRQRLQDRTRAPGGGASKDAKAVAATGMRAVQAAAAGGVDDRQLKRALVQSILADQFGSRMINDAKFQQVVGKVTQALDDEPQMTKLLDQIVCEMRAPG